jgi:hypothetical protein
VSPGKESYSGSGIYRAEDWMKSFQMHTSKEDISRQWTVQEMGGLRWSGASSQTVHGPGAVLWQRQPTKYGVTVLAHFRRTIDLILYRASTTRRSIVLHLAAAVSLCISPLLHRRYSSAHNLSLPPMSEHEPPSGPPSQPGPRYQGNQISGDARVQLGDIYNISSLLSDSKFTIS